MVDTADSDEKFLRPGGNSDGRRKEETERKMQAIYGGVGLEEGVGFWARIDAMDGRECAVQEEVSSPRLKESLTRLPHLSAVGGDTGHTSLGVFRGGPWAGSTAGPDLVPR
jgi:hypothetical protein